MMELTSQGYDWIDEAKALACKEIWAYCDGVLANILLNMTDGEAFAVVNGCSVNTNTTDSRGVSTVFLGGLPCNN